MNKYLTQFVASATAILAMSSDVTAQMQAQNNKAMPAAPFERGEGMNSNQYMAGYNAPARIEVQNGWDVFFTGSFTYWYVNEAGFELAINTTVATDQSVLYQSNKYSPGFKVGMGFDFGHDSWVAFAEYTWLRNHSTYNASAASSGDLTYGTLFSGGSATLQGNRHINLDLIDATLSRPLYQGRMLTLSPSCGLRGAWLRQKFEGVAATSSHDSHSNSNSWFVGPRAGVAAHWMLGWGFRFEGDMGAAILFQQSETNIRYTSTSYTTSDDQNSLAPVADMGLGLGWGTYLNNQNYHLDFVATYDFMNWWGQNLIRGLADTAIEGIGSQPGDLQISGLTITGRFDF